MSSGPAGVIDVSTALPIPKALQTETPAAPVETPLQKRDRLRQEVRARGVDPLNFESITGDCENQKATQIRDLQRWLAAN